MGEITPIIDLLIILEIQGEITIVEVQIILEIQGGVVLMGVQDLLLHLEEEINN